MKDFTGVPDTDIQILLHLSDDDLASTCTVSSYARHICNMDKLWISKLNNRFGDQLFSKPINTSYREYYNTLANTANRCIRLNELMSTVKMVYEDFYIGEEYLVIPDYTYEDQYFLSEIVLAKLAYNRTSDKTERYNLEENVKSIYNELNRYDKELVTTDMENLPEQEKEILIWPIDNPVNKESIQKHGRMRVITLGKNIVNFTDKDLDFLIYLHDGFRTKLLPLDVLWSELCSNIYVLKYKI